jgi:hypothetical protein
VDEGFSLNLGVSCDDTGTEYITLQGFFRIDDHFSIVPDSTRDVMSNSSESFVGQLGVKTAHLFRSDEGVSFVLTSENPLPPEVVVTLAFEISLQKMSPNFIRLGFLIF